MTGRRLAAFLALAAAALVVTRPPARAQVPAIVEIKTGSYVPRELQVSAGTTVRWIAQEDRHTVTSADGLFDFPERGELREGETVDYTFAAEGIYPYYCRLHGYNERQAGFAWPGCGMCGRIYVDVPIPTPRPTPTPRPAEVRDVPSAQFPKIADALKNAPPGTIVNLAPKTYFERVTVQTKGIWLRGTGTAPEQVVIDGGNTPFAGIAVDADDVTVSNLKVRRFTREGVSLRDVSGYTVRDVVVELSQPAGIGVHGGHDGVVDGVRVSGAGDAGLLVEGCLDCDLDVRSSTFDDNTTGVTARNAGGVVVRDSVITRAATGVVLRTSLADAEAPQRGTQLVGTTIDVSQGSTARLAGDAASFKPPSGTGVFVDGGWFDEIAGNTIVGHSRYGMVVASVRGVAYQVRVANNVLAPAGGGAAADLAWDGLGAFVCFSGNTGGGGAPVTSPDGLQERNACDTGVPVGLPNPAVTADVVRHAIAT